MTAGEADYLSVVIGEYLAKSLLEGCEGENPSKCTLTWFATAVVAVFLTV